MLTVRVTDIWTTARHWESARIAFNTSLAQTPPPPGGRQPGVPAPQAPMALTAPAQSPGAQPANGAAPPAMPNAAAPPAAPTQTVASATPAPAAASLAAGAKNAAPPAVPTSQPSENEAPTFSQTDLDVLQRLSERRTALDAREQDLVTRENLVKAAEQRIDKKIAEMKALQTSVEGMLKTIDTQDDAKVQSLVKIYQAMKPKDAAKIFEQLDLPILLSVIERMKEGNVAPIMAAMDPMKAKMVTDGMALRRAAKAEGGG